MGGLFGGPPKMPAPPPPPPPVKEDNTAELEALARKRKSLNDTRKGRSALVVQPENTTGLRLIE